LFIDISNSFNDILPPLSNRLETLERIAQFGEHYGSRKQFLKACTINLDIFKALTSLFDQSSFIYKLLCTHPEIFEELLYEAPKKQKTVKRLIEEIQKLPKSKDDFLKYLWLYVKAEQVRLSIQMLLYDAAHEEIAKSLSNLADSVLKALLNLIDPEEELTVIALGKYGSEELSLGSDLDLLIIAQDDQIGEITYNKVKELQKNLHYHHPLGNIYKIDLRLKPYGNDSFPVTSLDGFKHYHYSHAKLWERQILTRARFVSGNRNIGNQTLEFIKKLNYTKPLRSKQIKEILTMFERIQEDKLSKNPELSFKYTSGGLLHIEFFVQILQLMFGSKHQELIKKSTINVLNLLINLNIIETEKVNLLLDNYRFLRKIEFHLQINSFKPVTEIEDFKGSGHKLAKWLHFRDPEEFWSKYYTALDNNKKAIDNALNTVLILNS